MHWTQTLFAKPGKALPKPPPQDWARALKSKACWELIWQLGRVLDGAGQVGVRETEGLKRRTLPREARHSGGRGVLWNRGYHEDLPEEGHEDR